MHKCVKSLHFSLFLSRVAASVWTTSWFRQPIDHFNESSETFQERYLLDASSATPAGPLLFFCGNEGDVETFANFSRFVPTLAKRLGGVVVYAEHRFYGQSIPFKASSFSKEHVAFLTVEQALADYAGLLGFLLKSGPRKVITIGGSYGGMLSSWMRSRYPSLVFAALASSAPIRFDHVGPSFFSLVTKAASAMNAHCPQLTRAGFAALESEKNWTRLRRAFGLCQSQPPDSMGLKLWARNAMVTAAMGNYPYSSDLFGKGLPAWPLKNVCEALDVASSSDQLPLWGLAAAVNRYYNASGSIQCHNISQEYRTCADQTGCGDAFSAWGQAWDVEACRQIVYFTSTDNITDMFPPHPWGLSQLRQYCLHSWNITPQPSWFKTWFSAVANSSRIIFTNGLLDPWRGGGVLANLSDTLVAVSIPDGAHIYDLAGPHVNDTVHVKAARERVTEFLAKWLGEDIINV